MSTTKPKLTRKYLTRNGPTDTAFKKLPVAKKRVAIATDALRWIKSSGIIVTRGSYVEPTRMYAANELAATEPAGVQCILNAKCEVCAKGGLFLATVMRTNATRAWDVLDTNYRQLEDKVCYKDKIFSPEHFDLIECVFENGAVFSYDTPVPRELLDRWQLRFPGYVSYINSTYTQARKQGRLTANKLKFAAICVNIIQNNGKFVPEKLPTVAEVKRALARA